MNISTYSVTTNEEIQKVMEQNKEDILLFYYNNYVAMCVRKNWTEKFKYTKIEWGKEIFGKQILGNFENEYVFRGFPQYADDFNIYSPRMVMVVGTWLALPKAKKDVWKDYHIAILKDVETTVIIDALKRLERELGY